MDMNKNVILENVHNIHLIAACGSGMGALAGILKDLGYTVTGSDQGVYPPMSDFLARKGIPVREGFSAAHLETCAPDLVVVGNAVIRDNPEAKAVAALGLPFCSMPQALNHFFVGNKQVLMITGTHGKTTTAALLAWILHKAGRDPSFFIGGILRNFGTNYRIGSGDLVVMEGDEYDTAFFDKGPKFLHYRPRAAVLTGMEFDHADIYRDLGHIRDAFGRLVSALPENCLLAVWDGNADAVAMARRATCRAIFYGHHLESQWRIGAVAMANGRTQVEIRRSGEIFGVFETGLMGDHNRMNLLAAVALAHEMDVSPDAVHEALKTFRTPKRRQEIRGIENGVTVMDDFAHHPTAVRETLKAVRPFYGDGRVIAVFEPRTNTSMRRIFQEVYPTVFDDADMVLIREPSRLDKIPEGERFSAESLVGALNRRGKYARHFPDTEAILDFILPVLKPKDLVLIMSNGGFDNIHERLLNALSSRPATARPAQ